jgi:hypothetical protein
MISRSAQFMLVGFLFWKFGAPIKGFIEKYLGRLTALFLVLIVGGFVLAAMLSGGGEASHKCARATLAEQTAGAR